MDALPRLPFRVWAKTKEAISHTGYLYLDPDGRAFTNNPEEMQDVEVGSLRDTEVQELWRRALQFYPGGPWAPN